MRNAIARGLGALRARFGRGAPRAAGAAGGRRSGT
jgi:hypothetical protein